MFNIFHIKTLKSSFVYRMYMNVPDHFLTEIEDF